MATHAAATHSAPATSQTSSGTNSRFDAVVLTLLGIILLIGCAICVPRIEGWSHQYGNIPTFLTYFVFASVGGRLFWSGIDQLVRK